VRYVGEMGLGIRPIYTYRFPEGIHHLVMQQSHLRVTPQHIYGVLSMMVWSLIVVISIKYLSVVLRADNKGEGGIIALVARLGPCRRRAGVIHAALVAMGVFGASLLYGDGTITRAISVLSAIEAINHRLAYTEIDLNLSEVKGPVMDASNEPTFSRNSAGVCSCRRTTRFANCHRTTGPRLCQTISLAI
jgi:hypothetical protein